MIVEKIKELAEDLRRVHQDLKTMQTDMRMHEDRQEREVDIDKLIEDLNTFKLNAVYLRLKANEIAKEADFTEVRSEIRYFIAYLKTASDRFNEIVSSMTYSGRSGDDAVIQKAGEEIWILQRNLREMNSHLTVINAKLGKKN